jgi:hypothetical protein
MGERPSIYSLHSEPEDNNSDYENDDFLVADDAPIETYETSHDDEELDDGESGSASEGILTACC